MRFVFLFFFFLERMEHIFGYLVWMRLLLGGLSKVLHDFDFRIMCAINHLVSYSKKEYKLSHFINIDA